MPGMIDQITTDACDNEEAWPWCPACSSYHHPDNPTCKLKVRLREALSETRSIVQRLAVGDVLMTLATIKTQIGRLVENFERIPDATPTNLTQILADMRQASQALDKKLQRLEESNK